MYRLNAPTKRHRLNMWIQKQNSYICSRRNHRLQVLGWTRIFHANRNQKKAGVAILISDKVDFKTKAVKTEKEAHYIMIKGSIQEEDITNANIYIPNIGAPQHIRQMLLVTAIKEEINSNIIIVGDFISGKTIQTESQ